MTSAIYWRLKLTTITVVRIPANDPMKRKATDSINQPATKRQKPARNNLCMADVGPIGAAASAVRNDVESGEVHSSDDDEIKSEDRKRV